MNRAKSQLDALAISSCTSGRASTPPCASPSSASSPSPHPIFPSPSAYSRGHSRRAGRAGDWASSWATRWGSLRGIGGASGFLREPRSNRNSSHHCGTLPGTSGRRSGSGNEGVEVGTGSRHPGSCALLLLDDAKDYRLIADLLALSCSVRLLDSAERLREWDEAAGRHARPGAPAGVEAAPAAAEPVPA